MRIELALDEGAGDPSPFLLFDISEELQLGDQGRLPRYDFASAVERANLCRNGTPTFAAALAE
jgi:hypothetical protein